MSLMVFVVGPQQVQSREVLRRQLAQHFLSPLGVIHIRGGHHDGQQQPHGVNHDMALRPFTSLPPSVPCRNTVRHEYCWQFDFIVNQVATGSSVNLFTPTKVGQEGVTSSSAAWPALTSSWRRALSRSPACRLKDYFPRWRRRKQLLCRTLLPPLRKGGEGIVRRSQRMIALVVAGMISQIAVSASPV
jgi:hypothetical protein